MPLVITPEVGIPLPLDVTPEEVEQFRERAAAACATLQELMSEGAQVEVTDEDSVDAHHLFTEQKAFNVAKTPPGAILKLEALLSHYDHEFLGANRRIANYVTNRLLEETEDEDPKVRLKALELLGKRSKAISRKLKDVEALPASESQQLLPDMGLDLDDDADQDA